MLFGGRKEKKKGAVKQETEDKVLRLSMSLN